MKQSEPGPAHSSSVTHTAIVGADLMHAPVATYEYGSLSEIFNPEWPSIFSEPIEHAYVIKNHQNQREVWHVHHVTTDRYVLLSGELDIALYDNRSESQSYQTMTKVRLTALGSEGFHGLRIPAGVWHTFRSIDDGFSLINFKTPKYDRENPDKFEIPFDSETVSFSWD